MTEQHRSVPRDPDAPVAGSGALVGPGVLVAAGMAVGQVLGYLLSILGARLLGPALFGELSTLMSLLVIGAVVPLAVQTAAARRVAASDSGSDPAVLLRLGLVTGLAVMAVGLVVVPIATRVLSLEPLPTALVALALLPLTLTAAGTGLTQGRQRFARLGWFYAVAALGRTGLAVAALLVTRSVLAVMVATAVGSALSWLVIHRQSGLPWRGRARVPRAMTVEMAHTTHALLAMFVFTNTDLLLARSTLSPEDAGAYAAGAIVLKIAFWLPQAVAVVVFPSMAEGVSEALGRGVAVVVALGLSVTAAVAVLGPWLLPLLIGPDYAEISGQAWLFGLAGTAEAVAYLLLFSRIAAQDRLAAVAVWAAVGLLVVVVVTVGHGSARDIAVSVLGVSLLLCAAGVWAQRRTPTGPVERPA